jgi:hypothetical protein
MVVLSRLSYYRSLGFILIDLVKAGQADLSLEIWFLWHSLIDVWLLIWDRGLSEWFIFVAGKLLLLTSVRLLCLPSSLPSRYWICLDLKLANAW